MAVKFHRIAPGYYRYDRLGYEVKRWIRPESDGYGKQGQPQWVIIWNNGDVSDPFNTLSEIRNLLERALKVAEKL